MKELDPRLKEVGNTLKNAREERSMTMAQMSEKMKVDRTTIGRYEKGLLDIPLSKLFMYADVCDSNARIDLTKKTNGINELMAILRREISKIPESEVEESEFPGIILEDDTIDYIILYAAMVRSSKISKKTLSAFARDITAMVQTDNKMTPEELNRRLTAYAKYVKRVEQHKRDEE